jgi:hypothetical protein
MAFNLRLITNLLPVKKFILTPTLFLIAALLLFSCSKKVIVHNNPQGLPPGQAKKLPVHNPQSLMLPDNRKKQVELQWL